MNIEIINPSSPGASFTENTNQTILQTFQWIEERGYPIIDFKEMRQSLQKEFGINDNNARNIFPLLKNCGFINYSKGVKVDTHSFLSKTGLAYAKAIEIENNISSQQLSQSSKAKALNGVETIKENLIYGGLKNLIISSEANYCQTFKNVISFLLMYNKINKNEFAALVYYYDKNSITFLKDINETITNYRNDVIDIKVTVNVRDDTHGIGGQNLSKRKESIGFLTSFGYFIGLLVQSGLAFKEDDYYQIFESKIAKIKVLLED